MSRPSARVAGCTRSPGGVAIASNLITMTYGGTTFTYSYDNLNRNAQVSSGSTNYATFTFRPDGQVATILYGNNVKTTYTFDPKRSWPLHLWANASGGTGTNLLNMVYTYNAAGEVTKLRLDRSSIHYNETYTYDGQDRILKGVYTSGSNTYTQTYRYDAVGNRLNLNDDGVSSTYTYRKDNRLVRMVSGSTATNYHYDLNGNLYQRVQGTTTRPFTFDYAGLLAKVADGSTTVGSFEYAGQRRGVKGVPSDSQHAAPDISSAIRSKTGLYHLRARW